MQYDKIATPHPVVNRSIAHNYSHNGKSFSAVPTYSLRDHQPVVQRVSLNIDDLDTENWAGIQAYALAKLRNGRDDLINILKMRVKSKAPGRYQDLVNYLSAQADEHAPAVKRTVPSNIHMIWMGSRISDAACSNIIDAHSKLVEGFTLTLWTDKKKSDFLGASPGSKLVELSKTHSGTFKIRDGHGLIDERIKKTYNLALERDAYSMASDLARYSVLLAQGGIYMDVDVKMGSVDPSMWDMEMSQHGLPMLGPNIRDKGARNEKLPMGLGELNLAGDLMAAPDLEDELVPFVSSSFNKMFRNEPAGEHDVRAKGTTIDQHSTLGEGEKTKLTAKTQYMSGNVANQFIAAPRAHAFIDFLIAKIADDLEKRTDWQKEQVAALTGPSKFGSVILAYYASQYGVRGLEPRERRHTMDPRWLSQVVDIQWLTEESENQEMQVAPAPKGTYSPWLIPIVIGAVAILGLAAYTWGKGGSKK